jgi:CubicO group peptidase (beta-lactamase class C family)
MSRLLKFGIVGAVVAICVALAVLKSSFWQSFDQTGNGYGSKLACGAVFGAGRSLEHVLSAELTFPPVKYGREFTLDMDSRCVSVQGRWPFASPARKACFRSHRLGCHLIPLESKNSSYQLTNLDTEDWGESSLDNLDEDWPLGNLAAAKARVNLEALDRAVGTHFADTRLHARAFILIVDGQIVYEKYGDGCNSTTRLLGWSATKSLVNALIGLRVQEGALDLNTTLAALIPEWHGKPHLQSLTIKQALQMSDGLDIDEHYIPGGAVTDMLFVKESVKGFVDHSAKTARRPRGEGCFHYSSATTNLLCRALAGTFQSQSDALKYPTKALFAPLRAHSFRLEAGSDGGFLGSSFGWATARDWAKLGQFFLNGGKLSNDLATANGQMLPKDWVKFSTTPTPTSKGAYGAHFWLGGNNSLEGVDKERVAECDKVFPTRLDPPRDWLRTAFPQGTFLMHGFEEQCIAINPLRGIVLVRLGASKEVVLKWDKPAFYSAVFAAVGPAS